MRKSVGVAVFVKTPDFSPVKTRLAKDIGTSAALKLYKALVNYMKEALTETAGLNETESSLEIYWAIAEPEAELQPIWSDFPRLIQPSGELGSRIAAIVDQLVAQHDGFILVGADCPYLKADHLIRASRVILEDQYAIGPAKDGGFWLFGGPSSGKLIDFRCFQYSQNDTLLQIDRYLTEGMLSGDLPKRSIHRLSQLEDIDDVQCLHRYGEFLMHHLQASGKLSYAESQLLANIEPFLPNPPP